MIALRSQVQHKAFAAPVAERMLRANLRARAGLTSTKRAADYFGISPSYFYGIINGNAKITETVRDKLLAKIREEELDLADRISAEWGW